MSCKLIYFYASWCRPCRYFKGVFIEPLIEAVGSDRVIAVNADLEPDKAERYGVTRLPWAVLADGDSIIDSAVGITDLEYCKKILGGKNETGI